MRCYGPPPRSARGAAIGSTSMPIWAIAAWCWLPGTAARISAKACSRSARPSLNLSDRFPAVAFLYPVHPNPNVREPVHRLLSSRANVQLIEPAPYPEFVWLMDRASIILTDSGGVQEEAPSLRKPVLVTRETTERPEAVAAGTAELVGADYDRIVQGVATLLEDRQAYASRQASQNPYGDGFAAERIIDLVLARAWEADRQFALPSYGTIPSRAMGRAA